MKRQVILHIGTHRTGTTAIQQALADEREGSLAEAGYHYPHGMLVPNAHPELWFVAIRRDAYGDRPMASALMERELGNPDGDSGGQNWLTGLKEHVARTPGSRLIYSFEGLYLLRYRDEVERLKQIFSEFEIWIVVFTREAQAFLDSYAWSMRIMGNQPPTDPESRYCTSSDSWLTDYEANIGLWREVMGDDHVHHIDYDRCMAEIGSSVTVLFDFLGAEPPARTTSAEYFLNARPR